MNTTADPQSKRAANQTKSGLASDYDDLKQDISQLRADLRALFEDATGYAGLRAKDIAEDAGERFGDVREEATERVKAHPLTAVGIAFGAGLLIALLSRK